MSRMIRQDSFEHNYYLKITIELVFPIAIYYEVVGGV